MDSKLFLYAALGIGGYIAFQKYVAKKAEAVAAAKPAISSGQNISLENELNKILGSVLDKVNTDIVDGHPSMTPNSAFSEFYAVSANETQFAGHHCG